jgi:hypothetical protein
MDNAAEEQEYVPGFDAEPEQQPDQTDDGARERTGYTLGGE